MNQHIQLAIKAIENYRGDDLARARFTFRGLTQDEMNEQHGESGRTRQQVLDGYINQENECNKAIAYLRQLENE